MMQDGAAVELPPEDLPPSDGEKPIKEKTPDGPEGGVTQPPDPLVIESLQFAQQRHQFSEAEKVRLAGLSPEQRAKALEKYDLKEKILKKFGDQADHPAVLHPDALLDYPLSELKKILADDPEAKKRFELLRKGGTVDELFKAFAELQISEFERMGLLNMAEQEWNKLQAEKLAAGQSVDEGQKQQFLHQFVIGKLTDEQYLQEREKKRAVQKSQAELAGATLREIIEADADGEVISEERVNELKTWWQRMKESPYVAFLAAEVVKGLEAFAKGVVVDSDPIEFLNALLTGRGGGFGSLERGQNGESVVGVRFFKDCLTPEYSKKFGKALFSLVEGKNDDEFRQLFDLDERIERPTWDEVKNGSPEEIAAVMAQLVVNIFSESESEKEKKKWEYFSLHVGRGLDAAAAGLGVGVQAYLKEMYDTRAGKTEEIEASLRKLLGVNDEPQETTGDSESGTITSSSSTPGPQSKKAA